MEDIWEGEQNLIQSERGGSQIKKSLRKGKLEGEPKSLRESERWKNSTKF